MYCGQLHSKRNGSYMIIWPYPETTQQTDSSTSLKTYSTHLKVVFVRTVSWVKLVWAGTVPYCSPFDMVTTSTHVLACVVFSCGCKESSRLCCSYKRTVFLLGLPLLILYNFLGLVKWYVRAFSFSSDHWEKQASRNSYSFCFLHSWMRNVSPFCGLYVHMEFFSVPLSGFRHQNSMLLLQQLDTVTSVLRMTSGASEHN